MNILETTLIRSPNEKEEECAKFIIDDVSVPFVFHNVTDKDKNYVFSAWVKAETESTLTISNEEIPVTTEWQRQRVGYVANGSSLKIFFDNVCTYYLYRSQLEIGNAMTDWSPAPEDIEAGLEVKVNTEDLISEINASANVIRLKSNRLVVESDNLQISEDGTLKTQRGEIGGFVLDDNVLTAEADRFAEINIKYKTHADAEEREGYIRIGNNAENNDDNTGEAGIFVKDYDLDGNGIFTRIGNVLGGGILIETEEPNEALHIGVDGIHRVDGHLISLGAIKSLETEEFIYPVLEYRKDLDEVTKPNTYIGNGLQDYEYFNCPITDNDSFTLEVMPAGGVGQLMQRITTCNKVNPKVWIRHYYTYAWGDWIPIIYDTTWNESNGGYCQYRAKNGICTVKGGSWGTYTLPKDKYTSVGIIPEDYRPTSEQYFISTPMGGTVNVFGRVTPDGNVYLYTNGDNTNYWVYSVTYPI